MDSKIINVLNNFRARMELSQVAILCSKIVLERYLNSDAIIITY